MSLNKQNVPPETQPELLSDPRQLIEHSRSQISSAVNCALSLFYWRIGRRIQQEVVQGERAAYGEQIVLTLSRQFFWRHFLELSYLKDPLQRELDTQGKGPSGDGI